MVAKSQVHEDQKVLLIPKWFTGVVITIFLAAGGWAYSVGTDISAMRVHLSNCLEKFVEQDSRIDRIEDRVHRLETKP